MNSLFDGLGTAIIMALLGGSAIGGGIWYLRSSRVKVKQKQKAGDNASQIQSGRDTKIDGQI